METFILIITYSVMVLIALSLTGAALVTVGHWLVANSAETQGH